MKQTRPQSSKIHKFINNFKIFPTRTLVFSPGILHIILYLSLAKLASKTGSLQLFIHFLMTLPCFLFFFIAVSSHKMVPIQGYLWLHLVIRNGCEFHPSCGLKSIKLQYYSSPSSYYRPHFCPYGSYNMLVDVFKLQSWLF